MIRCIKLRRYEKKGAQENPMPSHEFKDTNRYLVEVPDSFAIARWSRDADAATIARCILGTVKYEPHTADTTVLRRALEGVVEHEQLAASISTTDNNLL